MRRLLMQLADRFFCPRIVAQRLNPNTYPNNLWYRQNLDRNYDIICMGNADFIPRISFPAGVKAFDWSLQGQNLIWDFNVVKHFFSILKPNGSVVFPLSASFLIDMNRKVDERKYYIPMMPYFFSRSPIKKTYIRVCKHIPLLAMLPSFSVRRRQFDLEKAFDEANELISEICEFLDERGLKPFFFLIPDVETTFGDTLLSLFKGKQCFIKVLSKKEDYNWDTILCSIKATERSQFTANYYD